MMRRAPKHKVELLPWAKMYREQAAQRMKRLLGHRYRVLGQDVEVGAQLLQDWVLRGVVGRRTLTAGTSLFMFQNQLEFLDSVDVLLTAGAVRPAQVQGRAHLEAAVSLLYLLKVCDDRVAAACMVSLHREVIAQAEQLREQHVPGSGPTITALSAIEELQKVLGEGRLSREANRELQRLEQENGGPVPWYQSFNGPRTLRALVRRLEIPWLDEDFDVHYERWSETAHGGGWQRRAALADVEDGLSGLFQPLRRYEDASIHEELLAVVHTLFLVTCDRMRDHFGLDWPPLARPLFQLNEPLLELVASYGQDD